MTRYSRWFSVLAYSLLILACLLPWSFYPDLQKNFDAFFSERNVYGKPGKFLLVAGSLTVLAGFIPWVWMKRTSFFVAGINMAYAIKNFLLFGACYQGTCPEKKAGLWLMLISTFLLLLASLFPHQGKQAATPATGVNEQESVSSTEEKP